MNHNEILIKSLEMFYNVTIDKFLVTVSRVAVTAALSHDTLARYRDSGDQGRLAWLLAAPRCDGAASRPSCAASAAAVLAER
jgi:hypothetical protein